MNEDVPAGGVKLKNKRKPNLKLNAPMELQERGKQFVEDTKEVNQQVFKLAQQFMGLLRDTKLEENKTSINTDIETEVKNNLINIMIEINNDPNQDLEGMGSATVMSLMLKGLLTQRDTINKLSYKVAAMESQLSSLSKAKP